MIVEFVSKVYDNHSLSIVTRNIILELLNQGVRVKLTALDNYDPKFKLAKEQVKTLKSLENETAVPDIQVRHSYPPIWAWPEHEKTKVVFIQPWEYSKVPFEWQYKFEQFADALVVPSNYCRKAFLNGGINPKKVFTVPNGYDTSIFNKEPSESYFDTDKFTFVYVGNHQWRKGLDLLLTAWSQSFVKADKARLVIKDNPRVYGQSNILNDILRMQYNTKCAEVVYIDDELSSTDMAKLFKSSQVLVHPYRAEGFAMHVQEAAACGCLPIIPALGPTDDFIPDDHSIKLPVYQKHIDITDPRIFAIKPGDATSLMGAHTFVNEPSIEHLATAMHRIYHSHTKDNILSIANGIEEHLYTWPYVAGVFKQVLEQVHSVDYINRSKK